MQNSFAIDLNSQRDLIQTMPAEGKDQEDLTYNKVQKSVKSVTPKSISHPDQSCLRLDDVILNGKRVSVEDKSEWMITSKSRTSDYQET